MFHLNNKLLVTGEQLRGYLKLSTGLKKTNKDTESSFSWLQGYLSEDQLKALNAYRQLMSDKKQAQIQEEFKKALETAEQEENSFSKRDVSPVWRLCVVDYRKQDKHKG